MEEVPLPQMNLLFDFEETEVELLFEKVLKDSDVSGAFTLVRNAEQCFQQLPEALQNKINGSALTRIYGRLRDRYAGVTLKRSETTGELSITSSHRSTTATRVD